MSALKKVCIEFGESFSVAEVEMTDGKVAKVVSLCNEDGEPSWVVESLPRDEKLEDYAVGVVKACFYGIVDHITKE